MTSDCNCIFCDPEKIKSQLSDGTPCKSDFYEDEDTFAILAEEQYTTGHALLILKNHKTDITYNLLPGELSAFINAIHKVSKLLKRIVKNDQGEKPERIYVCILCDGVEHLHAHLIPRYPFTHQDKNTYQKLFINRDNVNGVYEKIKEGKLGGYWYIAEREKNWKSSEYGSGSSSNKAKILEDLAKELRWM